MKKTPATRGILYGWKEIATYIGCTPQTVRKYAATQSLPVKKVAGRMMISKTMIELWLRNDTQKQ